MKYADCPTAETELFIAAPPARVWRLVSDIATPVRFSSELYEVEWLDGATGPAAGARFVGRNQRSGMGRWETTARVCGYQPERLFAWQTHALGEENGEPGATWRFELHPEEGGTRLRQWVRIGPGSSGVSHAVRAMPQYEEQIVTGRLHDLQQSMRSTLAGIKALAEQPEHIGATG